jgi:hypothetical protein
VIKPIVKAPPLKPDLIATVTSPLINLSVLRLYATPSILLIETLLPISSV